MDSNQQLVNGVTYAKTTDRLAVSYEYLQPKVGNKETWFAALCTIMGTNQVRVIQSVGIPTDELLSYVKKIKKDVGDTLEYSSETDKDKYQLNELLIYLMHRGKVAIHSKIGFDNWLPVIAYLSTGSVTTDTVVYYNPVMDSIEMEVADEFLLNWINTEYVLWKASAIA